MRIPDNLVQEFIKQSIGDDAVSLVMLLKDKENISEFKLADKLKITINQVRNILYRLSLNSLVTSTRKKDKKKGWYIYFWTLDNKKTLNAIINFKQKKIEALQKSMETEKNEIFYICPNKCIRIGQLTALELQYRCHECNQVLKQEDNTKRVEKISRDIEKVKKELEEAVKLRELFIKEEEEKAKPKAKEKVKKVKIKIKIKKIKIKKIKKEKKEKKQKSKIPKEKFRFEKKKRLELLKRSSLVKKRGIFSRIKRKIKIFRR